MLRYYLIYIILSLYIFLNYPVVFSQSNWKIDNNGWVLKKQYIDSKYEKFFAIGLWGLPINKLTDNRRSINSSNIESDDSYLVSKTKNFNIIVSHSGYLKDFFSNKICMIGSSEFPWYFKQFLIRNNKGENLFQNMDYLEYHATYSKVLDKDINRVVNDMLNVYHDSKKWDYIWAPIDEVWKWPSNLTNKIYKTIKSKDINSLVYVNLLGNGRIKPYSITDNSTIETNIKDFFKFQKEWYNNVYQTALIYKESGDVFGINSYNDFYLFPSLVGTTVDAIKSATANAPVWLYFDFTGYAKSKSTSFNDYLINIRCQVYSSLIHGATGVLFWNDGNNVNEFNEALVLIEEIVQVEKIMKMNTFKKKLTGDIRYIIKNDNSGNQFLIATNVNKKEKGLLLINNKKIFLNPLQVYIGKLN